MNSKGIVKDSRREKKIWPHPSRSLFAQWWKKRFRAKPISKEVMINVPNKRV
jgi:hypothetical protein